MTLFKVVAVFLMVTFLILTGCKKDASSLAAKSPTGMVIAVSPETRTASLGARGVYQFVPRELQPQNANVAMKELDDFPLATLASRDKLAPSPIVHLVGYTQFPLNNPDEQTATTNIYLLPHRDTEGVIHTAVHEWGHYVYWMVANAGERATWDFVYQTLAESSQLAQGYEGSGPKENFAEYFALWTNNRNLPHPVPAQVSDFFNKMKEDRQ